MEQSAIVAPPFVGASFVQVVDLNGDDLDDVLVGSSGDNKVLWYPRVAGTELFSEPREIGQRSAIAFGTQQVEVADVDDDGDSDVLVATNAAVDWYDNNGQGEFRRHVVMQSTTTRLSRQLVASDVDGDRRTELFVPVDNQIQRLEWSPTGFVTLESMDFSNGYSFLVLDMDEDGDQDLLQEVGGRYSRQRFWRENTDGQGAWGVQHELPLGVNDAFITDTWAVADIDGDGDDDLIAGRSRPSDLGNFNGSVFVHDNVGHGSFSPPREIERSYLQLPLLSGSFPSNLIAFDVDLDRDVDLVFRGFVLENDGHGNFRAHRDHFACCSYLAAGNLDADPYLEIAGVGGSELLIRENDERGSFFAGRSFGGNELGGDYLAGDLDSDGDVDVMTFAPWFGGVNAYVYWNTQGTFEARVPLQIVAPIQNERPLTWTDINGDGARDLVSELSTNQFDQGTMLVWRARVGNLLGVPTFFAAEREGRFESVDAVDWDQDGDLDLVAELVRNPAGTPIRATLVLNNRANGSNFTVSHKVGGGAPRVVDLNQDGQLDLTTQDPPTFRGIVWYPRKNDTLLDARPISSRSELFGLRTSVFDVFDVDHDGDTDLVTAAWSAFTAKDLTLAWIENVNKTTRFDEHAIPVPSDMASTYNGWTITGFSDFDHDLDLDFVPLENSHFGEFTWAENQPVNVEPWSLHPLTPSPNLQRLQIIDIDGDGADDLLTLVNSRLTWFRNQLLGDVNESGSVDSLDIDRMYAIISSSSYSKSCDLNHDDEVTKADVQYLVEVVLHTSYGDTNLDGVFDSSDIVLAFQHDKFETDQTDATWIEGDWNGDHRFDTSDFVLAFQTGRYVA